MLTPWNLFCLVHSALPFNARGLLLFSLDAALEIDLSHLLWLIAAIVVLVLAGQFVFVFAIIAHHSILDVRTYRIPPTLCWEADLAEHARLLLFFASDQPD